MPRPLCVSPVERVAQDNCVSEFCCVPQVTAFLLFMSRHLAGDIFCGAVTGSMGTVDA